MRVRTRVVGALVLLCMLYLVVRGGALPSTRPLDVEATPVAPQESRGVELVAAADSERSAVVAAEAGPGAQVQELVVAPDPEAQLDTVPGTRIRGRVVDASTGAPVDRLALVVGWSATRQDDAWVESARTDSQGCFEVLVQPESEGMEHFPSEAEVERILHQRVDRVWVRAGLPDRGPLLFETLDAGEPDADRTGRPTLDLGDIQVELARPLHLAFEDGAGAPVPGVDVRTWSLEEGRAQELGSTRSDDSGRAALEPLPSAADGLWCTKDGYVPRKLRLTDAPVTSAEVPWTLRVERATRLEVELRLPPGVRPRTLTVVARATGEGPLTAAVSRAEQVEFVQRQALDPFALREAARPEYLAARPEAEPAGSNMAVFHAFQPGTALTLELYGVGATRDVLARLDVAPLLRGEVRRVVLELDPEIVVFRGRVLDGRGAPLERAGVQLGNTIVAFTRDDGNFAGLLRSPQPATLLLQHSQCSTLFLHDYVVPAGGRPVEFRLEPKRRVAIDVVDEAGDAVSEGEVWVHREGFVSNTQRVNDTHFASGTAGQAFEVELVLAGQRYRREVAPDEERVEIVVPVHGSVEVDVPGALRGLAGELVGTLVADAGRSVTARQPADLTTALLFPAVLPGTYRLELRVESGGEPVLAPSREVTVRAGERGR